MNVWRDGDEMSAEPSVVAIGVFDGLHRGHRAVIAQLLDLARTHDAVPTIITFDPPPARVLAPDRAPLQIATIEQRLEGFAALGVARVRLLTFTPELSSETAAEFIERVIVGELHAKCVLVGEDFRFGHDREGDAKMLREAGARDGFDVVVAPTHGGAQRFSSSAVRAALAEGDLDGAARILDSPFVLRGYVRHGDQRGSELGYPTANLGVAEHQALPSEGVYAGSALVERTWRPAAISVGTRPQFYDDGQLLVEVYVLDYEGSLYDQILDVAFFTRLRDQRRFDTVEELVAQIALDVARTRELFALSSPQVAKLLGSEVGQRR